MIVSAIVSTATLAIGWLLGRYVSEYKGTIVEVKPHVSMYGLHVWHTRKGYGFTISSSFSELVRREKLTGDLLVQQLRAYKKKYYLDETTLQLIEEKIYG